MWVNMTVNNNIELVGVEESSIPINKDIRIVKYIEEWRVYPNGDMYFMRKYPIGQEKAKLSNKGKSKGKKRVQSKPKIKAKDVQVTSI